MATTLGSKAFCARVCSALSLVGSSVLLSACAGGAAKMPDAARDAGGAADAGIEFVAPSAGQQFLSDYASAVCAMYEPCCETEGLGYDGPGCAEWYARVSKAYFQGEYSAERAAECLSALAAARAQDSDRCSSVLDFDEATLRTLCRRAFEVARGSKQLGESCRTATECAGSPDGSVICYGGLCLLERHGAAGDGPCYLGSGSGIDVPTEAYRCEAEDGLYCHRTENQCVVQVDAGEYCPFPGACKDGAPCVGGMCQALPGPGERCLNVAGAGALCSAGSACDVRTFVCGPPLPEGAPCREGAQCESGSCMDDVCAKPEFTRSLNCTGG